MVLGLRQAAPKALFSRGFAAEKADSIGDMAFSARYAGLELFQYLNGSLWMSDVNVPDVHQIK